MQNQGVERRGRFAFVPAEAYLVLSSGSHYEGSRLDAFTTATEYEYRNGRDFVQKPYMQISGELDMLYDDDKNIVPIGYTSHIHDVVEMMDKGARPYPTRSLIIEEGNHLTPVTRFSFALGFLNMESYEFGGFPWNVFIVPVINMNIDGIGEAWDTAVQEGSAPFVEGLFTLLFDESQGNSAADEDDKLDTYKDYTLAFWDTYLSPEYDFVRGQEVGDPDRVRWGSELLALSPQAHKENGPWVWDDEDYNRPAYVLSERTHVVELRSPSGANLLHLRDDGDVCLLRGSLTTGAQITEDPQKPELLIKDSTGTFIASAEETSGLKLHGQLYEQQSSLSASETSHEFLVKDGADVMVKIDEGGNLYLRGDFYMPGETPN